MKFSSSGFVKGAAITVLVGVLLISFIFRSGMFASGPADDPASLAKAATDALEAVRRRQPGERRPASYDAVLAPLDKLLAKARDTLGGTAYDPVADFETVRSLVNPVIDIASQADRQARGETGPLTKEYRFNDQKGEACQYLATAIWERLNARRFASTNPLAEPQPFPSHEIDDLMRILSAGIEAAPQNRDLWYIRGVVNRAEGMFAPAARDLERAISLDGEYAAAWNTLGLVRISLKEFDRAEEALERAKILALEYAERINAPPGEEYVSIIYNLGSFHENLAIHYSRENRLSPTVETRRLLERHAEAAKRYIEDFLALVPSDSGDAKSARSRLNALPL